MNTKMILTEFKITLKNAIKHYRLESNKLMTQKINTEFTALGKRYGFIAKSKTKGREWLYDLVWFDVKELPDGNKQLKQLVLALESELGIHEHYWSRMVKPDFEKLLVTNAEFRLMICFKHKYSIGKWKELISDAIKEYELLPKREKIFFLIWDDINQDKVYDLVFTKE